MPSTVGAGTRRRKCTADDGLPDPSLITPSIWIYVMGNLVPFELALFLIAAFTGALVSGIAGFAFRLFASAIWRHVVTAAQSAALIAAFAIVRQGLSLWKLRCALTVSGLSPYLFGAG